MKEKLNQYKHVILLLYFPVYLSIFRYLENNTPKNIHIISSPFDQYIPFIAVFIVPYLLWFVYMAAAGIYFLFFEKECFCRMMYFGMIGMSIFLLVSWLYPNGLQIRPLHFAQDNLFTRLTQYVYSVDTATNVLPSIHVFNSIGVCAAISDSERLGSKKVIQAGSFVMTVLIILSTMFVKQHSMVDVIAALILACFAWDLVYGGRAANLWNVLSSDKYRKKGRNVAGRIE